MIVFMYIRQREPAKIVSKEWKLTIVFLRGLNVVSPEGNGRTQRVFFTQWVTQKLGWHLDLASTNSDELMIATIYAAQGVMDYLIDCFDGALQITEMDSGIQMDLL